VNMRGLFCVDPGGHTGVAWSVVNIGEKTAADAMRQRLHRGSDTLEGPEAVQIRDLYKMWVTFKRLCVTQGCMEPEWVELVFEDFVLRGGQHAGGRDGTWPERIAWGFEGYRMARADAWHTKPKHYSEIVWQMPGAASTYRTRERLTAAEAWVKGREHERSAYSHMILRLNTLMDKHQVRRR
jgi:hypothetical protein